MKKCILLLFVLSIPFFSFGQDKELVIAEMNYCCNTLYNIEKNGSMESLQNELQQLEENLRRKELSQVGDASLFAEHLNNCILNMKINEAERQVVQSILAKQREGLLWQSISKGISPTMIVTRGSNPLQLAFYAILSTARSAVEYKSASNQMDIEELKQMWEIEKKNLGEIKNVKKEAFDLITNIYAKYDIPENARFTSSIGDKIDQALNLSTPDGRALALKELEENFSAFVDYYYYLGMAYADNKEWNKANDAFSKYETLYSKAPIFLHNEKLGCIALARIANVKNASIPQKKAWIKTALDNLPDNGSAIILCALCYIEECNETYAGLNLLKKGIINTSVQDNDLMVKIAANYMSSIKKRPTLQKEFRTAINSTRGIDINTYLDYLIAENAADMWDQISNAVAVTTNTFGYNITVSGKYSVNSDNLSVMLADSFDLTSAKNQSSLSFNVDDAYSLSDLKSKFSCFKSNSGLIPLFFDKVGKDSYIVKQDLTENDFNAIRSGSYKLLNTVVTAKERGKLADFCKKYHKESIKLSESKRFKREVSNMASYFTKTKINSVLSEMKKHNMTYNDYFFVSVDDVHKSMVCYTKDQVLCVSRDGNMVLNKTANN